MKNKKTLASLVFLGTLSVAGVAGIATFAYLLNQSHNAELPVTPGNNNVLDPIIGNLTNLSQTSIGLSYEHLGWIQGTTYASVSNVKLMLTGLLPYVGKNLFVGVYDPKDKLLYSTNFLANGSTGEVNFTNLASKTKYQVKVFYLKEQIFTGNFETKTLPGVSFTPPSTAFTGGVIQLTALQSYLGTNDSNKLYISLKKASETFYGSQIIPVDKISNLNDFSVELNNLVAGESYTFKIIEDNNGVFNDLYIHPTNFTALASTAPRFVVDAKFYEAKVNFSGLSAWVGKELLTFYRLIDQPNTILIQDLNKVTVAADGTGSYTFRDLLPNREYEFVISSSASTSQVVPIDFGFPTRFRSLPEPTINPTVTSFDAANITLSGLSNYGGQEVTFVYQSQNNLFSSKRARLNVGQDRLLLPLSNLDANSTYNTELFDNSGQLIISQTFKTLPKVTKQRYEVGIGTQQAVLKFSGGLSYQNQDLILLYREIGKKTHTHKVLNVKDNLFEFKLEDLSPGTSYQWELIDSGRNVLLYNKIFITKQAISSSSEVIGNAAFVSLKGALQQYTNNGFIYLRYWSDNPTDAKQLLKNVFDDEQLLNDQLDFELNNLKANTTYNFEAFTYEGATKKVLNSANFTTGALSNNLTLSGITSTRAVLNFNDLTAYQSRDLLLELLDEFNNKKTFNFTAGQFPSSLVLSNLFSNKKYTLKLFSVWSSSNSMAQSKQLLVSSSEFRTLVVSHTEQIRPSVVSSSITLLGLDGSEYQLNKHVYKFSLEQLEAYIGKTLVLKYWDQSTTETSATTKELVLTNANTNWYSATELFTDALTSGLRYNFKIGFQDTPNEFIWEETNVFFNSANIVTPPLNLQFSNLTKTGFRVNFSGFEGATGQKVAVTPRPLANASEANVELSATLVAQRIDPSAKQEAIIDANGSFSVNFSFNDLARLIKTSGDGSITLANVKLLQFFVQKTDSATEFYGTPKTTLMNFSLPTWPAINQMDDKTTENSITLRFNNFPASNEKFVLKYAPSNSQMAANNPINWWSLPTEISFVDGKLLDVSVGNLENNTRYNFRLLNSNNEVVNSADYLKTKTGFAINFLPTFNNFFVTFSNPQLKGLTGKSVQFVVSEKADFSNSLTGQVLNIPVEASLRTSGFDKVFGPNGAFRSHLKSGIGYYYKVVEVGSDEAIAGLTGKIATFAAYQLSSSNVTRNAATIKLSNLGILNNPFLLAANLYLEYAENPEFTTNKREVKLNLNRNSDEVNVRILGLRGSKVYYFRIANKATNATSIFNDVFQRIIIGLRTRSNSIDNIVGPTSTTLAVFFENSSLMVRYGLNGQYNLTSTTGVSVNSSGGYTTLRLENLQPNSYYTYEITDYTGYTYASGDFYTKPNNVKIENVANGANSRIFEFSNISGYQGEKIRFEYRKVNTVNWIKKELTVPNAFDNFNYTLSGLEPGTEYEFRVIYKLRSISEEVTVKEATNFTTPIVYTPPADAAQVNSTVTAMGNFSARDYTPVASLNEIYATEADWQDKLSAAFKYINMTPQRTSGQNYTSQWFALQMASATADGNVVFKKITDPTAGESLDAYFFFQYQDKRLNALQLNFKLVNEQIQMKLGKVRWITLNSATQAAELRKKSDFNFVDDLNGGEALPKAALQNGLNQNGYARLKDGETEGYVTVSGLKLVAKRTKIAADDQDKFFNRYNLSNAFFTANESNTTENYFSINETLLEKRKIGLFTIGNADYMMGNLQSNAAESLVSLGIISQLQLENLITNNPQFGLGIKSFGNQIRWLFGSNLKISKSYVVNREGEVMTALHFLWLNGRTFEGITLNLGVNREGVVTLSQNGSALSLPVLAGETLASQTWDNFVLQANPVGDFNIGLGSGFGIGGMTLGVWTSPQDPGLHYHKQANQEALPSSTLAFIAAS